MFLLYIKPFFQNYIKSRNGLRKHQKVEIQEIAYTIITMPRLDDPVLHCSTNSIIMIMHQQLLSPGSPMTLKSG